MTFGLKNVGAMFQRCKQRCLYTQLGRNVHVHVDDVVVKTKESRTVLEDLKETFASLREFKIRLNPEKCVFGVPAGQLLGFLVSERGIEANPEKNRAIERMGRPTDLAGVQKVTGCLASLSSFINRMGLKALPLYGLLKKADGFIWSDEDDEALHDLKRTLTTVAVLAAPEDKEPMLLYIPMTSRVVSIVMAVERSETCRA